MVSLVTRQFECKYHNETVNSIIELDPGLVYVNMRLINLSYNGGNDYYCPSLGVLGLIKRVQLMDGNIEIDALDNVPEMAKLSNLTIENRKQNYLRQYLHKTGVGYSLEKDVGYMRAVPNGKKNTASKGYVDLKFLLDFLAQNPIFSFKNPRLVIEWNTDFNVTTSYPRTGGLTIPAPSLLVDQLMNQPAPKQYIYKSWIRDRVTIPQTPDANVQRSKTRLNAFNKRLCGKGIIQMKNQNISNVDGATTSLAQPNEKYQIFLDNRPLLEGEGETLISKQHRTNEFWGDMNILYSQYQTPLSHENSNDANNSCDPFFDAGYMQEARSNSSYGTIDLSQERFNNLEIEYERQGAGLPQCTLILTCEVWKNCQYDNNGDAVVNHL